MRRLPYPSSRLPGFSLLETLVAIAGIAILAAVLVAYGRPVLLNAKRAQDAANLREMGAALEMYLNDNNKMLPRCWVSLPCNPRLGDPDEFLPLSGHLAPYMGASGPRLTIVYLPTFQCPAYPTKVTREEAIKDNPYTPFSTYRLVLGALGKVNPFGGKEGSKRLHYFQIEREFDRKPSEMPVVFNLDQHVMGDGTTPKEPVFKVGRNVLFLDGNVRFETTLDFLNGLR